MAPPQVKKTLNIFVISRYKREDRVNIELKDDDRIGYTRR